MYFRKVLEKVLQTLFCFTIGRLSFLSGILGASFEIHYNYFETMESSALILNLTEELKTII